MNNNVLYGALAVLFLGLVASWVVILGLRADVAELQDSQSVVVGQLAAMEAGIGDLAASVDEIAAAVDEFIENISETIADAIGDALEGVGELFGGLSDGFDEGAEGLLDLLFGE